MSGQTGIEWTDSTWNPIRGCSRVSEGCRNCYAETVAHRFSGTGLPYEGLIAKGGQWNGQIKLVPELLDQPLRWKKPRRIFVNSMSDLFHESVPDEFIDRVFASMVLAKQHTFQVLTKRPDRMRRYITGGGNVGRYSYVMASIARITGKSRVESFDWPPQNVWLGVSVEDQKTADERIPLLLQTPAAVRWISAEPLLGAIDLEYPESIFPGGPKGCCDGRECGCMGRPIEPPLIYGIDWVVVGGESGKNARPMHPDWARSLRDQCKAAGVAYLHKQNGEYVEANPLGGLDDAMRGIQWHTFDDGVSVRRVGKKAAGRHLDGVLHDEYPVVHP